MKCALQRQINDANKSGNPEKVRTEESGDRVGRWGIYGTFLIAVVAAERSPGSDDWMIR